MAWVLGLVGVVLAAPEICNGLDDDNDGAIDNPPLLWFPDTDNDNFGDPGAPILTTTCDNPGDAVILATDCDDTRNAVKPGASETCNGRDDDCDAVVDEEDCDNKCDRDSDGNSHFLFCDRDEEWQKADDWCVDVGYSLASIDDAAENQFAQLGADAAGNPLYWWIGLEEDNGWVWVDGNSSTYRNWANGQPNGDNCAMINTATGEWNASQRDCDVKGRYICKVDCEGMLTYADADGDGFGNPNTALTECTLTAGRVRNDLDCNDGLATDGVHLWFRDADGDGYGAFGSPSFACNVPNGYVADGTDCDDGDVTLNPGSQWFVDADGDGYGSSTLVGIGCSPIGNAVRNTTDCNDNNGDIHPDAQEICSPGAPVDEDCDGTFDDNDASVDLSTGSEFWPDLDNDGHGAGSPIRACAEPVRHAPIDDDCDDMAPFVFPGAPEQCNDRDDNCDLIVDNGVSYVDWYADSDGDGFGDASDIINDCIAPDGYVLDRTDCDDADGNVNPDGVEIPGDGIDQDCVDGDAEGTGTTRPNPTTPTTPGTDTVPTEDNADPAIAIGTGCGCEGAPSTAGAFGWLAVPLALTRRRLRAR